MEFTLITQISLEPTDNFTERHVYSDLKGCHGHGMCLIASYC